MLFSLPLYQKRHMKYRVSKLKERLYINNKTLFLISLKKVHEAIKLQKEKEILILITTLNLFKIKFTNLI